MKDASDLVTILPVFNCSSINDSSEILTTIFPDEGTNEHLSLDVSTIQPQSGAFLSREAIESFNFIAKFILIPVICSFGLVGNSMGITVLWQGSKQQKMSIYFYLFALTLSDILYITLGLLRTIPEILMKYEIKLAEYIDAKAKPSVIYLDMVFSHTASAMIIVMSFERLLALVRPLTVKYSWFGRYPSRIVFICVLFNVLFMMPYPVNFEVVPVENANETDYSLRFKEGTSDSMRTFMFVQRIVDNFIPVVILIGTNVAIPIQYYRISKRRLTALNMAPGQSYNPQTKITMTVFVITLVYMLLQVPILITLILPYVDPEYAFDGEKKLVFWFFVELGNIGSYFNAANDFLIYILVSRHYRSVFKEKYCACFVQSKFYIKETDNTTSGYVDKTENSTTISMQETRERF